MTTTTNTRTVRVWFERVRGFQPPWRTIKCYQCSCGQVLRLRVNWRGGTPSGAVKCTNPACEHYHTI